MDVRQQDVERIVVEVLKKMMSDQPTAAATTVVAASGCDCGDFGLFDRLEDAVQAAEAAQKKISTVAMRDKIIAAIRKAGLENAKAFAEIAHNETGMGRVSDKIAKNILVCERTPGTECLSPMAISGDMGLTLIENAPWGVIASVTPSTNPTATVINNAISMIAGGNSVIFAPHPNAKRASQTAIQVLNKAIIEATGVANLLVAVKEPTIEVAQELFSHPRIKLLVVTGGEAVVAQARKVATMRLIAAGAATNLNDNIPVVVGVLGQQQAFQFFLHGLHCRTALFQFCLCHLPEFRVGLAVQQFLCLCKVTLCLQIFVILLHDRLHMLVFPHQLRILLIVSHHVRIHHFLLHGVVVFFHLPKLIQHICVPAFLSVSLF